MYYILTYETVDNYVEKRQAFREEHLSLLTTELQAKHVVLGGALEDPADKAIIIWKVDDKKTIQNFVDKDPYVQNGLVSKYEIRPWNVVIENLDPS